MRRARTALGRHILDRLAELNDQLSYHLFLQSEFESALETFGPAVSPLYTTDVFARNKYAPKIHVRMGELPRFHSDNQGVALGAYVSTSYEVASTFFAAGIALLTSTNGSQIKRDKSRAPEEAYYNTMTASGAETPDREVVDALKFARLRRNHFVHLAAQPSDDFVKLAASRGVALNAYWKTTALDFSTATVKPLYELEAIELIKIIRISTDALDEALSASIDPVGLTVLLALQAATQPGRVNQDVRKLRAKRVIGTAASDYGVIIKTEAAMKALKEAGS